MRTSQWNRRSPLRVAAYTLAAAAAIATAGAPAAPAQPPPPACGPGQKPSTDLCFPPAECQAGQDPVLDECTPGPGPFWPDPPGQTQECARYYTYQGNTKCAAISSHYTYAGQPVWVDTPYRYQSQPICYHLLLEHCLN